MLAFALVGLFSCQRPTIDSLRVPTIKYTSRILPNGLKIYTVLDRSSPDVTVQVWYRVGSKDDPAGRSGFAHLFEHMMFKGGRQASAENLDRITESVGGTSNASTMEDYTEYHEVVPGNQLERMLRIEAGRMADLVVNRNDFLTERLVVEHEISEDLPDDGDGLAPAFDIPEAFFAGYPYGHPSGGTIKDLQAATLDDVTRFHSLYYRPDNAVLVVAGRFSPRQLDGWIDRYFGPITSPAAPVRDMDRPRPIQIAAREIDAQAGRGDVPWVVVAYPGPRASASPDAAALTVLEAIMNMGRSPRAYASLVYREQLAEDVFSDVDLRRDAGVIYFGAVMAPGVSLARGEAALHAEIVALQTHRVSQDEVAAAKVQLLAKALADRQTIDGLAAEIGRAAVVEGDAAYVNMDLAAIRAVSARDVERVARTYLSDARRTTIRSQPGAGGEQRPAGDNPRRRKFDACVPAPHPTPMVTKIAWPGFTGRGMATPPSPRPFERTLANGLQVIVARAGRAPLASALLTIRGGASADPPHEIGVTDLVASAALAGAAGRSRIQIATRMDSLGLSVANRVDPWSSTLGFTGPTQSLADGLAILRDVVRQPRFDDGELRRLQRLKMEELSQSEPDLDSQTDDAAEWLAFGGRGGRSRVHAVAAAGRITRSAVLRQYGRLYRPDNAILVLTGRIQPGAAFALAERIFGSWTNPPGEAPRATPARPPSGARTLAIDEPEAGVAEVAIVKKAMGRADPDRPAAELASSALGGSYTARLDQEIRVRRGLTYDATSDIDDRPGSGLFSARAQTDNCSAPVVAALMLHELAELGRRGPTATELAVRKAAVIGDFERATQTSGDLADLLTQNALAGSQARDLAAYPTKIQAVSAVEAQAAAARLARPQDLKVLVIGDVGRFLPELRRRFGRVDVLSSRNRGARSTLSR
jgi:zinc protease